MEIAQATEQPMLARNLTVLYVEDEDEARGNLARYLSRRVGSLHTASNGQAGLDMFIEQHPQLVISDIRMPLMDGIAMCQAIRKQDPQAAIIMLTAHNESESLLSSIDMGVTKYIIKPVNLNLLMEAIDGIATALEQERQQECRMQKMSSFISEVEYENEKVNSYVAKYFDGNHRDKLPNIRHLNIPKGAVSGDFFCIAQHGQTLYALIADGAGHGLAAVVPALHVPRIFMEQAGQGFSLLTIADEINRELFKQHITGHFVAATLVRMNQEERFIEVLNCGNPPALLVGSGGGLLREFQSNTFALGMINGDRFDAVVEHFKLDHPARLYVFTDGLGDTLQAADAALDYTALLRLFSETRPAVTFDGVEKRVRSALVQSQPDDVTLLEILYEATPHPTFTAPAPSAEIMQTAQTPAADMARIKFFSMLLVEDDDITRDAAAQYLDRRVGILYTASNGLDGLKLFQEHRPQLVVADILMPVMDGIAMIRQIRLIDKEVPIIVCTGSSAPEYAELMVNMGVTRLLPKPLNVRTLVEVIADCIKQFDTVFDMRNSASVFHNSSLAIMLANKDGRIISVNPAFCRITGYAQQEIIGRNLRLLGSGKHDEGFYRVLWDSLRETGAWSGEIWNRRKNGDLSLEWLTINAATDATGEVMHYLAVFSDVTERHAVEEKINHLEYHDSLTGLPNRLLFHDRLRQALIQAQRNKGNVALLLLDLDNFKDINDALGQDVGDALLRSVTQRLLGCVRHSDTVCRLGGDEFGILLTNLVSQGIASRLAEKIIEAIKLPHDFADREVTVSSSIGVSLYPYDGKAVETLIKCADSAMHQAKKDGKDNYRFFDKSLGQAAERSLTVQQNLCSGLHNQEFFMLYQPQYSLRTGNVVGAEALIRWDSPILGSVAPTEFIPVAEEYGLVIELSEWVIETVCAQMAKWKQAGLPQIPVSINISPMHFQHGNLVQSLEQALEKWSIAPELLHIEVTEGIMMSHSETAINIFNQLKAMGMYISIDDFGTGFSSLSYLGKMPISQLKIDRSFVKELPESGDASDICKTAIPQSIIQLAKDLELDIVAEGVETESQKLFLHKNGCDVVQGFLFSRPLSAERFALAMVAPPHPQTV